MPDELQLVHVSGGLLSPSVLADALSDSPRRSEFGAPQFGGGGPPPGPPHRVPAKNGSGNCCGCWISSRHSNALISVVMMVATLSTSVIWVGKRMALPPSSL